jgi:hydrogenase nickel incorporation protein HypA/HybF
MHEVGIVQTLIEQAARAADGRPLRHIHVRLGRLSDVSRDALDFYFAQLRPGTPAAGSDLVVRDEPGAARCAACGGEFVLPAELAGCPVCGSPRVTVVGGDRLSLEAVDVD